METLRRIIVVHGPPNAGKSTVIHLLTLRLLNELLYKYLHNILRTQPKVFPDDLIEWISRNDRKVLIEYYGKRRTVGRIALCSRGDTKEHIKESFEFAEDSRANILILACRDDGSSNKPKQYFDDKEKKYALPIATTDVVVPKLATSKGVLSPDVIKAVDSAWSAIGV